MFLKKVFSSGHLAATAISVAVTISSTWATPATATSASSDWFGTGSGWITSRVFYGAAVPTGSWSLQYKHWFAPPVPAAFSTFATIPYPAAAAWSKNNFGPYELPETSAAGSQANSSWEIDPYTGPAISGGGYYGKEFTKSYANAQKPDPVAGSITDIKDPRLFTNPGGPNGRWTVQSEIDLFGNLSTNDGTTSFDYIYSLALDSGPIVPVVDFHIAGDHSSVTVDPSLYASGRLIFTDTNGASLTPGQMQSTLDSYRTGSGWNLDPGFSLSAFQPDQSSQVSKTFAVDVFVQLQNTSSATVYTDTFSEAVSTPDGSAPEPASAALVACACAAVAYRRRRQRALAARAADKLTRGQ